MKGEISKNGFLSIERAGKMKKQYCPYADDEACGDWCPMFGEPKTVYTMKNTQRGEAVVLQICRMRFPFDDFVDRRFLLTEGR